jgi:cyclase
MSKIATLGSVLGLLLLASGQAGAQTDFSKVEMKTTDLGHRTYMIEGMGGNITAAVGDEGVIMVDGQFAPLHDKIRAAVAAISKGPIRYLVNTHFHGDHTGGNEGFAKDGTVVTAHENVANRLSAGTTNGLTGAKTPPAPQGAIPTRTYTTPFLGNNERVRTALLQSERWQRRSVRPRWLCDQIDPSITLRNEGHSRTRAIK